MKEKTPNSSKTRSGVRGTAFVVGWFFIGAGTLLSGAPSDGARDAKFAQARFESDSHEINVYGKVVDQFGQGVAEADVKGGTLLVVSPISSAGEEFATRTDAQGRFSFTGLHGARFGVRVEKRGYEFDPKLYLGWWDTYRPDPNNPAVFVMWKLQGAEDVIHSQLHGRLPYDARSAAFGAAIDLTTGKMTGPGELRVTMTQNPLVVVPGIDRFDWGVKIDVAGGGLVEAIDPYKNLAPAVGYQNGFSIAQTKDDTNWGSQFTRFFYVHTAAGLYGKVSIDLTPGSNRPEENLGMGIKVEIWLNPSGSRNLEFDLKKTLKLLPPRPAL